MTNDDTRPPASLLALCVLGERDSDDWQTVGELCDRIEAKTGERPNYETLRAALARLAEVDRVLTRTVPRDGTQVRQYKSPNHLSGGGIDTAESPIDQ